MGSVAMRSPIASSRARSDRIGKGIASITLAMFLFSISDATAKWLGGLGYAPPQIVFFRYLFGLLPVLVFIWGSGTGALRTRRPWAHALRACLVFGALVTFFTGLKYLPLAEAIVIAFTAPLFVTALSGPLIGERVGLRRWMAVLVGFLGILIIMRPGTAAFQPVALVVLASALFFALAILATRRMAETETNVAMLTYTTIGAGVASVPFMSFVWATPAGGDLWLFLMLGIVAGFAAYFMIVAYRHAPAAVIAPFDYSALIWGTLFGWIFWREQPGPSIWIGAAIIIASSLYIAHRETRR